MLKLKYLFEDFDLAKEFLKLYEHEEKNLDAYLSHFRISSNAIYPFPKKGGGACFLRFSPVEEKPFEEVSSELHLIEWLTKRGFPIMKPYPMKDGSLCMRLTTDKGTFNVSCFEEVPGETLEYIDGTADICYGYGRTLGVLHNALQAYPYGEERKDHKALLAEVAGRYEKYGAPETLVKELDAVRKELDKLPVTPENYGVVHYDFEPDNVLYDADTGAFGVIDPDDSIRCWYALDIVRALDAMDDVVDEEMIEEGAAEFLKGYRSVRDFTQEQENTLPLMRRLVSLESYATIKHVLSEETPEEPEWMVQVKGRLNYMLHDIEHGLE